MKSKSIKNWFNKLKFNMKDKLFLSFVVAASLVFAYCVFVVIFDIVQIVISAQNSAMLSGGFVAINVVLLILNVLLICFGVALNYLQQFALKRKNAKKQNRSS